MTESSITAARSPLGKPSTVSSLPMLPPSGSSLFEQRTRAMLETNSVARSTRRDSYWSRVANGVELLRAGKVTRKNCQTAVARLLLGYFSSLCHNICSEIRAYFAILFSLFFFIFSSYTEIIWQFATSIIDGYARIQREFGWTRALQRFVTLRNVCISSLYIAHAHLGSWLQSARRHTLNTIPGALLNAARAFISCLNGWMNTKEPGRFAEVSTCSSVMKRDRNTTFSSSCCEQI